MLHCFGLSPWRRKERIRLSATSPSSLATPHCSLPASRQSLSTPSAFLGKVPIFMSCGISHFHTLSFSVSRNPFVCHFENCRVYTNNSQSGTRWSPISPRHCTQVLSFHTLAHSFAPIKITTLLFSSDSALFAQNYPGGGCCFPRALRVSRRGGRLCVPRELL